MILEENVRQAYLAAANGSVIDGNRFFNKFFVELLNDPWKITSRGQELLNACYDTDANAYSRIHKGAVYYYLGLAAFLFQDYEMAAFYIDGAVSEDVHAGANEINNPSLAIRFVQLDSSAPENRDFVLDAQARIDAQIQNYIIRPNAQAFSLNELRNGFLSPSITPIHANWRTLATTFISFCLEWNYRDMLFNLVPDRGTIEPFFLHLFKGCVLFESLLKENSMRPWNPPDPRRNTLGAALIEFHDLLNINPALGTQIGGPDLQTVIADLQGQGVNEGIETAIRFTGRLRNTVGHNLGWKISLTKIEYQRLFQMVTSSCLHAIACLYSPIT